MCALQLPIHLSKESREPIYHQIEHQLKALIASGHIQAGTALPSIRGLAKDLEISVITIRRAYQNLEYQGFIETKQGKGTFVCDIEDALKQQVKINSVYETIEKSIETAMSYNYKIDQIEEIFHNILMNYKKGE